MTNQWMNEWMTLRKIPYFHLIFWSGYFLESHSFCIFFKNRPKLWGNCAFSQNFRIRKLGEITVFHAVWMTKLKSLMRNKNIFLQKADEGNTIVIIDKENYIQGVKKVTWNYSKLFKTLHWKCSKSNLKFWLA